MPLCYPVPPLGSLNAEVKSLINLSMASSSWKTYKTAVESFHQFRFLYNIEKIWPAPVDHIAQFVAYLSFKGLAASTVSTYVSGLSHSHKILNFPDNTKSFIIVKMLEGLRRKKPHRPDTRAPVSPGLLKRLISSLQFVCSSHYEAVMFSSAFSLAFYAMLRVSELAVQNGSVENGHALSFDDVTIHNKNRQTELHVKIRSSKTDQRQNSVTLVICKQPDRGICPIYLLQCYLQIRSSGSQGSNKLYTHFNGSALTKYQFSSVLMKSLRFCNIPSHIRSHSFRIGRATDLAKNGVDDEIIKQGGRWTSSSFRRYIRI